MPSYSSILRCCLLCLLFTSFSATASSDLDAALRALQARPSSSTAQTYVHAFPQDRLAFERLLKQKDKYQMMDYIFALEDCARYASTETIGLLLNLTEKVKLNRGGGSQLQLVAGKLFVAYSPIFARLLSKKSHRQQLAIINFLAGEGQPAPGYDQIMVLLERQGFNDLAEKMQALRNR